METASYFETYSRLLNVGSYLTTLEGTLEDTNEYPVLQLYLSNVLTDQLNAKYEDSGNTDDDDIYGMTHDWSLFPINTGKSKEDFMNHIQIDVGKAKTEYLTNFKCHMLHSMKHLSDLGERISNHGEKWDVMLIVSINVGNELGRDPYVNNYYVKDDDNIPVVTKIYHVLTNITQHSESYSANAVINKLVERTTLSKKVINDAVCRRIEIVKDVLFMNVMVIDDDESMLHNEFKFNISNPMTFLNCYLFVIKYGIEREILKTYYQVSCNSTIFDPNIKLDANESMSMFELLLCISGVNFGIASMR